MSITLVTITRFEVGLPKVISTHYLVMHVLFINILYNINAY